MTEQQTIRAVPTPVTQPVQQCDIYEHKNSDIR